MNIILHLRMTYKIAPFFFLLALFSAQAQQKFSKELSLITDNDLYISTVKDRYYTNGLFLNYRYLSKKQPSHLEKRIFQWELGHRMYTPQNANVVNLADHDRPFAAYLYGGFSATNVYKNESLLNISVEVGTIGENAFGKELQDFVHSIYGFQEVVGWKYQIKNALGINFGAEYISHLKSNSQNSLDVSWVSSANVGTVFTDISAGFYGRVGFNPLQKLANSIAFKTNLNNASTQGVREIESFLFLKPTVRYAFYDATIEGSFLNSGSIVTKDIVNVVFSMEIGLKFTANRFHFAYVYNYNSNKSEGLAHANGNSFGRISIHYLMH